MARLPQYWAPKQRVQPTDKGYNAFETAGRRIGSMYAETARQEVDAAKNAGELTYNAIEWPYVFADTTAPKTTGGVSIHLKGGVDTGIAPEAMPNLSAENAAARGDFQTPVSKFTGAIGKLFDVSGTSTSSDGSLGSEIVSGIQAGASAGDVLSSTSDSGGIGSAAVGGFVTGASTDTSSAPSGSALSADTLAGASETPF